MTYNLSHTVSFATRIQNYLSTASDNILVDGTRLSSSSTSPIVVGLPHHDIQFLINNNIVTEDSLISGIT
jgi:hypothetical protein